MNIHSTLNYLFPAGIVTDCGSYLGGSLEVHGLPKGTIPRNCEVLASGRSKFFWGRERQDMYLVKTQDFLIFLRIGPAGPDNGDGEFVVSRGHAPLDDEASLEFQTIARRSIERLCAVPAGPWPN